MSEDYKNDWVTGSLVDDLNYLKTGVEEYEGKNFTGKEICDDRNIKMFYNSRKHRFSSSELRNRTYQHELMKKNSV